MGALIARDLAGLAGLSADRKFATAYNAALQAANMAIACAGYRIMSQVGQLALGKPAHKYADYFETYRRKRNTIDYTFPNVATERKQTRSSSRRPSFTAKSKTGSRKTTLRSGNRTHCSAQVRWFRLSRTHGYSPLKTLHASRPVTSTCCMPFTARMY